MEERKIFLITGANTGLGYQVSLNLAQKNTCLILICKNPLKGKETLKKISTISNNKEIHLFIADLSVQSEVRKLIEQIKNRFQRIDVLINNAACIFLNKTYTADMIEMQFAVNHLAPFLLSNLLLDKLNQSEQGRIINVSSRAHARGKIHFDDINLNHNYTFSKAYNQSKLANLLFTYELANKLRNTPITVNCMHPGLMNTSIGNKNTNIIYSLLWSIIKLIGISPKQSAKTIVYLATSQDVNKVTGKFYSNCKQIKSSSESYDKRISEKLWHISEQLTGITFNSK